MKMARVRDGNGKSLLSSKNAPKRATAFTLIEIMVSVALLGIVLATVGPSLRRAPASTHGTALALAAAFTEARQQAIAQQVPVALVIPSGSEGQSDSYYIVSGDQPRLNRVQRLGGEQPDVRLLVGHWSLDSSQLDDPALTTTVSPPPGAALNGDFDLDSWGLPYPNDFAFVFTPRGKLVTNDLPRFDGAYHVVVSHGGRCNPAAASGTGVMTTPPTLYTITQVGSAYTVNLDPNGLISVTPGLAAADSGVQQVDKADIGSVPNPPAIDPPPTADPVVTSVTVSPDPTKLTLPTGVDMLLAPDRHMTMTVRAESPERMPLFCQWTSGGVGGFSSDEPVRMTYLPAEGEWEGVWLWRPPTGAAPGALVTLQGRVSDGHGNEVAALMASSSADPVVQVGDSSLQVSFSSDRGADSYPDIYLANADGSGLTNLVNYKGQEDYWGAWSPDGQRCAFITYRVGTTEIFLMNADGSGQINLSNHPDNDDSPVWSPDGCKIAFVSVRDGNQEIYVMNADGSGLTNLTNSTNNYDHDPVWSPNGDRIAFLSDDQTTLDQDVFVITLLDGSVTNLTATTAAGAGAPLTWSPDGTQIAFATFAEEIFRALADGTGGQTSLTNDGRSPVWSPDGSQIAFCSDRSGDSEVYLMNAADGAGVINSSNSGAGDDSPVWCPDASRLAFASYRDGNAEIYLVNRDISGLLNVSKDPRTDSLPTLLLR